MVLVDLFVMILVFIFGLLFIYLLKKQIDKLKEDDRNRIMDLLILGFLLNYFGFVESTIWGIKQQELGLAGMVVFIYGFIILTYKSFKQGLKSTY